MKCNHCSAELPDYSVYCAFCGTSCSPVVETNLGFDNAYLDPSLTEASVPQQSSPIKPKLSTGKKVLACIAAVLVVVIIAGLCTNWFGYYGPATRIALGAKNVLKKGNFTIESTYKYGSEKSKSTTQIDIDYKNRDLLYLQESDYTDWDGNHGTYYTAIYDGYSIYGWIMDDGAVKLRKYDVSDAIDDFFDAYEEAEDFDWDNLFDTIEDYTDSDLDDVFEEDEFVKSCKRYFRKLNSSQWLKKNAGYTKTYKNGTTYFNFEPKGYTFLNASLDCFEKAFDDEDDFDDAKDYLKDNKRDLNDVDIEISIGVKGGKLAEVSYEIDNEGTYNLKIVDVGRTYIDENFLEELFDLAE